MVSQKSYYHGIDATDVAGYRFEDWTWRTIATGQLYSIKYPSLIEFSILDLSPDFCGYEYQGVRWPNEPSLSGLSVEAVGQSWHMDA